MIVVDANVLVFTLLQGEKTEQALKLRAHDPIWRVPAVWRYEFSNVLATYVRAAGMPEADSLRWLDQAMRSFAPLELDLNPRQALEMANRYRLTAYDAQYIALAAVLGVPCVTEDGALRKKVPGLARSMSEILTGPTS